MIYDRETMTEVAVNSDYGTAGTFILWTPGTPAWIKKLVLICTVASTVAPSIVTLGIRNVDDTSSVTLGTFSIPAGIALNNVRFVDLIKPKTAAVVSTIDGSTTYFGSPGMPKIKPGQELFATTDGAGTGGSFNVHVNYMPDGFNERATVAEQGYAPTELAFTPA